MQCCKLCSKNSFNFSCSYGRRRRRRTLGKWLVSGPPLLYLLVRLVQIARSTKPAEPLKLLGARWLGIAIVFLLGLRLGLQFVSSNVIDVGYAGVIGADISIKWPTATRPGDLLHLEITVDEITLSNSRPDRGNVVFSYDTINQHGEFRQRTTGRIIAWRRPRPQA